MLSLFFDVLPLVESAELLLPLLLLEIFSVLPKHVKEEDRDSVDQEHDC